MNDYQYSLNLLPKWILIVVSTAMNRYSNSENVDMLLIFSEKEILVKLQCLIHVTIYRCKSSIRENF